MNPPKNDVASGTFDKQKHADVELRTSTFGHLFAKDDSCCFYHSLKILPVYFPALMRSWVEQLSGSTLAEVSADVPAGVRAIFEELASELCRLGHLVPVAYDENLYLERARKSLHWKPQIRLMVLHVTDHCNLDCRYCYMEGGKPPEYVNRSMSREVLDAALEGFCRWTRWMRAANVPTRPTIVFYGGEPLLNFELIRYGLDRILELETTQELRAPVDKVIITNGTEVTPSIAALLRDHGVRVAVSLDGPQTIHDRNRVYRSGRGSFQDSFQGLETLREAGLWPSISCVTSRETVSEAGEVYKWLVHDLGANAIGFNHVSIVPQRSYYDVAYENAYADSIIAGFDYMRRENPFAVDRKMSRKVDAFRNRRILRADCTGCGEQVSVSSDGEIGICQGYMGNRKHFVARVFDETFEPASDQVFCDWAKRSPLNIPECINCPALAICGGGCPRNADFLLGSHWQRDEPYCHFAKKALEYVIWSEEDAALLGPDIAHDHTTALAGKQTHGDTVGS